MFSGACNILISFNFSLLLNMSSVNIGHQKCIPFKNKLDRCLVPMHLHCPFEARTLTRSSLVNI